MIEWVRLRNNVISNIISFSCIIGIATLFTLTVEHRFTIKGVHSIKYAIGYRYGKFS